MPCAAPAAARSAGGKHSGAPRGTCLATLAQEQSLLVDWVRVYGRRPAPPLPACPLASGKSGQITQGLRCAADSNDEQSCACPAGTTCGALVGGTNQRCIG